MSRSPEPGLLSRWLPVAVWAGVIWMFSTEAFSGEGTGGVVRGILLLFVPEASPGTLESFHQVVRKLAHVTEFAILALLLGRAVLRDDLAFPGLAMRVLPAAVGWAAIDELHQVFVPGRVGAVSDVLLDSLGVLIGFSAFVALKPSLSSGRRSPA